MPPARRLIPLLVVLIVAASVVAAALAHWLAGDDFPTWGISVWWAIQTVTTVGYGDVTPKTSTGRFIAGSLMVVGYAFVSILTAAVAASWMTRFRARRRGDPEDPVRAALERIEQRLERIENG